MSTLKSFEESENFVREKIKNGSEIKKHVDKICSNIENMITLQPDVKNEANDFIGAINEYVKQDKQGLYEIRNLTKALDKITCKYQYKKFF